MRTKLITLLISLGVYSSAANAQSFIDTLEDAQMEDLLEAMISGDMKRAAFAGIPTTSGNNRTINNSSNFEATIKSITNINAQPTESKK